MFSVEQIEELKNYFSSRYEKGTKLPNIKDVPDGQPFFLLVDGVYVEYISFDNQWHKKTVDVNSQVVLESL